MAEQPAAAGPPGEEGRVRLDRDRILSAAEAIVSREGVGALTMRRIGAELDADPTAVYRHFRNKDELLVQLADRLFGTGPELEPGLGWRETMRRELRHAHLRYRAHPDLAMLLAVQPDDTPSLQRLMEHSLSRLAEVGLPPDDAARMFHLIENHVVGTGLFYSLIEHSDDTRMNDPAAMRRVFAMLPADAFPHAVAAAPHLFVDLDESFDRGLELLLDAIEGLARKRAEETTTDEGASP
jgi:AcrR family transcriptional regulator